MRSLLFLISVFTLVMLKIGLVLNRIRSQCVGVKNDYKNAQINSCAFENDFKFIKSLTTMLKRKKKGNRST